MSKKGYSLVELLLYVGLSATIISALAVFVYILIFTKTKIQTISEVEREGEIALDIISQAVRNATLVNLPPLGESDSTLSLKRAEPENDPTIFSLQNGQIKFQKGPAEFFLTGEKVEVVSLTFRNLSNATSKATIRVELTLKRKNPFGRPEFNYQKNFYVTANLRI